LVVNQDGTILAQGNSFEEELLVVDTDSDQSSRKEFLEPTTAVYQALQSGLRNYVQKSGYSQVVLGLSGGIDSALTATLAADTLGPDNVMGILMPSLTSSEASVTDAETLAENLNIETKNIDISSLFEEYLDVLSDGFEAFPGTEEGGIENKNQHRIRGNILTTLANKYGVMPLCPGNKTELALGYTTLYGDLTGLLAPLADVPKTTVYEIARWRNDQSSVIPQEILDKPPSAELALDQRDEDDLASYETLDSILELYFEGCKSRNEIVEGGYEEELVEKIIQLVDVSEYKRRQAPTGLRVTSRRDLAASRTVPEVHHFYEEEYSD
jgi:NAD+ synthetase